ncbi:hypothetical protein Mro03_48070 [Microbispora rosea subsp. rosea]|nr:hypothetical protein Mro03_48070 [Microbispora rosea subsp. rosea]
MVVDLAAAGRLVQLGQAAAPLARARQARPRLREVQAFGVAVVPLGGADAFPGVFPLG